MQRGSGPPLPREERLRIAIDLIDSWAAELLLMAAKGIIPPTIPGVRLSHLLPIRRIWNREDLRTRTSDRPFYQSDIDDAIRKRVSFWEKASERFSISIIDQEFYISDEMKDVRIALLSMIKQQSQIAVSDNDRLCVERTQI